MAQNVKLVKKQTTLKRGQADGTWGQPQPVTMYQVLDMQGREIMFDLYKERLLFNIRKQGMVIVEDLT